MNIEEYTYLLENPAQVNPTHIDDLKAMLEYAPYCANTRFLLLKAMHKAEDIDFETELKKTVLYAPNPRMLYFLIYPKEDRVKPKAKKYGGDYFSMIETLQKGSTNTKESLQMLAEKLKQARILIQGETPKKKKKTPTETILPIQPELTEPNISVATPKEQATEELAKRYIRERRYKEAIEILEELSLINPKKKSIFADQIRFLKKIN